MLIGYDAPQTTFGMTRTSPLSFTQPTMPTDITSWNGADSLSCVGFGTSRDLNVNAASAASNPAAARPLNLTQLNVASRITGQSEDDQNKPHLGETWKTGTEAKEGFEKISKAIKAERALAKVANEAKEAELLRQARPQPAPQPAPAPAPVEKPFVRPEPRGEMTDMLDNIDRAQQEASTTGKAVETARTTEQAAADTTNAVSKTAGEAGVIGKVLEKVAGPAALIGAVGEAREAGKEFSTAKTAGDYGAATASTVNALATGAGGTIATCQAVGLATGTTTVFGMSAAAAGAGAFGIAAMADGIHDIVRGSQEGNAEKRNCGWAETVGGAMMATAPIPGIGWGVAVAGAGLYAGAKIYEHRQDIADAGVYVYDKAKEGVQAASQWTGKQIDKVEHVVGAAKDAVVAKASEVKQAVVEKAAEVKQAVTQKIEAVKDTVVNVGHAVSNGVSNAGHAVAGGARKACGWVASWF